jgi:quercetin dioxygenase-like cupin family protein
MTMIDGARLHFEALPGRASADPLRGLGAASSLRIVRLGRTPSRHAHRHPHSEEIIFVRTGSGTVVVDAVRHRVGPGDVVHIPPGAAHATIPDPGSDVELVCFFPHPELAANLEETDIAITIEEQG